MCFAILFSIWFLIEVIKNRRLPIRYEITPPRYDMVAKPNKNNHGVADFDAQAINISGGTMPKIVSEIRKKENIICGEYLSTKALSSELISKKKNSSPNNNKTKIITAEPPLKAVSFKNV